MFNSLFSTHVNKTHVFSIGTSVKPVHKPNVPADNANKPKKEDTNVQD